MAIKKVRKSKGLRQGELAKACGPGTRFIVDAERGKKTCQIGKVLNTLNVLGIEIELHHKVK